MASIVLRGGGAGKERRTEGGNSWADLHESGRSSGGLDLEESLCLFVQLILLNNNGIGRH